MTTLTLQPDATEGKDTTLFSPQPTTNFGTSATISAGERTGASGWVDRLSLAFTGLSSVPSDATVTAVTLSLWLAFNGNFLASNNRTLRFYRVRAARDWVEAQATWNIYKTSNNWGTVGCGNTTSDREATEIGSIALTTAMLQGDRVDISLTPGAGGVQDWVDGTLVNNGIVGIMDTELNDTYLFYSSDHPTAGERPKLVVEYTAADEVVPLALLTRSPAFTLNSGRRALTLKSGRRALTLPDR